MIQYERLRQHQNLDTLVDCLNRGYIIYEDRTYMSGGPKKWGELKQNTKSANFVALFRHLEEANRYIVAMKIVEQLRKEARLRWEHLVRLGPEFLLKRITVCDEG